MRRIVVLFVSVCLVGASYGQTYYEHGIIVRTYGAQSDAYQEFGALNVRQFTRAALVPLRVIENPFLLNPPDSVEWGILLTPHDFDGDGSCATNSAYADLIPAAGFQFGGCAGSFKDEVKTKFFKSTIACNAACTVNTALSFIGGLTAARRQTATMIRFPTTDATWFVAWRDTIEVCN